MTARIAAIVFAIALPAAAWAEEAFTSRATDLKESASADSRTVASLAADTPLNVTARGGGFARVEAGGRSGWVNVFHLRFPASAVAAKPGSGGLAAVTGALGFGRERSRETTIATTGVRGLTPEDLKNAAPDAEALRRLQSYRADAPAAQRFAREGKLAEAQVDYPEGGRR